MGAIGLGNLTEFLLSQTALQTEATAAAQIASSGNAGTNSSTATAAGDVFTVSAQNAEQQAVLFTVGQVPLLSPAGEALLAPAARTANTERQLQALNDELKGLGLNSVGIDKIDAIATADRNFDPASFAVLAFQLKAEQAAQQPTTSAAAAALAKAATG